MITLVLICVVSAVANYQEISSCIQAPSTGYYTLVVKQYKTDVICDTETDWGGWTTVINRISDQSVNFNEKWDIMAHRGVGSVQGDYMMPLDMLSFITNTESYELLVEMGDGEHTGWAFYSHFSVDSEKHKFKLKIQNYDSLSSAGDSLLYSNGIQFSTLDRDNDLVLHYSCAQKHHSPGWFDSCYFANPLGDYSPSLHSIAWYSFNSTITDTTLLSLSFKIRPRHCTQPADGTQCRFCDPTYELKRSLTSNSIVCVPLCEDPSCAVCSFALSCSECNSGYILSQGRCELNITSIAQIQYISQRHNQAYIPQGLILFMIAITPYLIATCFSLPKQHTNKSSPKRCIGRFKIGLLLNECCYRANSNKKFSVLIPFSLMIEVFRISGGLLLFLQIKWQALGVVIISVLLPLGYRLCLISKSESLPRRETINH